MNISLITNISSHASLISMIFSCLCHCRSSKKSLFLFVPTKLIFWIKSNHCNQGSNHCKRVLESTNLPYANIKKVYCTQKLGFQDFWQIADSALKKGKSAISPLVNGPEVLSSTFDKAKLFLKNFSKKSILDDSGISLCFSF